MQEQGGRFCFCIGAREGLADWALRRIEKRYGKHTINFTIALIYTWFVIVFDE
jgi:hypothetical protein